MSLKQIIYSENALQRMPSVVKLLQTNKLPPESLLEIYSNLCTLLHGTYPQRKVALCLLRSCLVNVMKQGNNIEHSSTIIKWWRGVMNCTKSRYTADIMFKMACVNAALIIELSETNIELQGEVRQHVQQLTSSCVSHKCKEGVEVLLALATYYPTVLGKSFEEVKLFCISHSREYLATADLFSKLTCVGPAGKHSINYTLAWSKMFSDVMNNLHTLMNNVLEQTMPAGESTILPCWAYTGSLDDYLKATDEMTWLTTVLSSLLSLPLSSPLTFPIKQLQTLVNSIATANTTTLILPSTAQNVFKRSFVSSLTGEFLGVLTQVVSVLTSSSWLLQSSLESLLSYLLQHREHTAQVLDLLQSLTNHGATFNTIPTICLLDLITPVTENTSHVDKKARNREFDRMNVEFKPNIDETIAEKTLVLLSSIIENESSTLLSLDQVKLRCANLLEHRMHFSESLVKETYKTIFMIARQQFDVGSVFKLFECERDIRCELSKELFDIEPHLHPERHVLSAERSVKETEKKQNSVEEDWDKENAVLFTNLPHRKVPEVNEKKEEEKMEEEVENTDSEVEIIKENEDDSDLMADSELLNKIKNNFHKIQNSVPVSHKPVDEPAAISPQLNGKTDMPKQLEMSNMEADQGSQLLDILSSFVDDPPSDAE